MVLRAGFAVVTLCGGQLRRSTTRAKNWIFCRIISATTGRLCTSGRRRQTWWSMGQRCLYQWASADATLLFLDGGGRLSSVSGDADFMMHLAGALQRAWAIRNFARHRDMASTTTSRHGMGGIVDPVDAVSGNLSGRAGRAGQHRRLTHLARSAARHGDLAAQAEARERSVHRDDHRAANIILPDSITTPSAVRNATARHNTATIFPSVAWWDGDCTLAHAIRCLPALGGEASSHRLGSRAPERQDFVLLPHDLSPGIGVAAVIPDWVSVAEYRDGHPLPGYVHLTENADLTWAQDPGK